MRNLYYKKYSMNKLTNQVYKAKALLLFLILGMSFLTYTFAQNRVFFAPSNIYPILNTTVVWTATDLQITTDAGVESYGVDIHDQSQGLWQQDPNDKLTVTTNVRTASIANISAPNYWLNLYKNGYYARIYAGYDGDSDAPYTTFNNTTVGKLNIINSWTHYLTSAYVWYYTWVNMVTKIDLVWQEKWEYDSLSGLNIYFRACPAVKDIVAPTFPNNQINADTNEWFPARQVNRQYRDDFTWVFWLLDNTNTQSWSNGWIDTPDFTGGSTFRPNATNPANSSITNQNGINSWSFVLQIKVATGWNHNTAQTAWSTWASTDTLTNAQVPLTPWGKTWRYLDKNYTGDIDTGDIADFGIEELVMISGYVEDRNMGYSWFDGTQIWNDIKWYSYRSGKNSTNFVYYFNQGMRPWFNTGISTSYTHRPTCVLDLERYQTGYAITTISGYLRDDWAGIDTSTVQVIVTGTMANTQTGKVYTQWANLTLSQYTVTGTWCRTDAWIFWEYPWGNTGLTHPGNLSVVCDDGNYASTGNYSLVFSDPGRTYDPEDPLTVSITYKDLKGKQWRPVNCSWWVEIAPIFVWTGGLLTNTLFSGAFANLIQLHNYPTPNELSPLNIQLQDDWAGVDTGTIAWLISGQTLNWGLDDVQLSTIDLTYTTNIYTQKRGNDLWNNSSYPNYTNWLWSTIWSIPTWQQLNYELYLTQTGNFAAEYPINLQLTFKDKDGSNGNTVSNPINVTYTNNEAPVFWEHTKTTNFTWWTDQKLNGWTDPEGISLTGEMAKLFSGNIDSGENRIFPYDLTGDTISQLEPIKQTPIAFKTTDNRAWVDSGTITLTITGNRRWLPYAYVFTASSLALQSFDRWDNWAWNLLNYLSVLTNHNIYFDRQSRGNGSPVAGRESTYTITITASDLKQATGNETTVSFTRDMENLSCQYLDRCNARLYFTYDYGTGVVPVVATGVHPFLWQTLYVIASGDQVIFTWVNQNYIACNGAGSLTAPITIGFENGVLAWSETNPYNNYQHSQLEIKDGMFELIDNVLVLK